MNATPTNVTETETTSGVQEGWAYFACVTIILYSLVVILLCFHHFHTSSRLLLRGFPVTARATEGIGATLGDSLVRLNAQLFLGLLQHNPYPDDEGETQYHVADMDADRVFNDAVSGIIRQTVQGKGLPEYLIFMRRCLQLLDAGYKVTAEDVATHDTSAVEQRLAGDLPSGDTLPPREDVVKRRQITI